MDAVIEVSDRGGVRYLTLARPERLNALNSAVLSALTRHVETAGPDGARCIVIRGAGERAFCAGADLDEINGLTSDDAHAFIRRGHRAMNAVDTSPVPVIAEVDGFALGGGFELMLACDITVAAEGTLFGEPEVRFGSGIIAMLLPWVTGPKQAKELLLTGNDKVPAERALAMGIVNRVVPADELMATATSIANDIAAAAPLSVKLTKRAINRTYEIMGLRQALLASLETDILLEASEGPERAEFNRIRREQGLQAAIAWRDAKFGRKRES